MAIFSATITAGKNKISLRRPVEFLCCSAGQPRYLQEPSGASSSVWQISSRLPREPQAHAKRAKGSTFSECFGASALRASISLGWLKFQAHMISKSWSLPKSGNTFSWLTVDGNSFSIAKMTLTNCRTASARRPRSGATCMLWR